jgi:site-specific DNA-methyltransferase (adenine-specific)
MGGAEGTEVWQGDCRQLAERIPADSVDLILTDPPYRTQDLGLWPDLGRLAQRVLRPGAFLVTYAGHLDLPTEMAGLAAGGLQHWWQAAVVFQGAHPAVRARGVRSGWRMVLIYVKPPSPASPPWFPDLLTSDPLPDKRYHEWGQGIGPFRQLLCRFSQPGGLVLDPFVGAGTVAVAALLEGRRAIAIEMDPGHAAVARQRLALAATGPQDASV